VAADGRRRWRRRVCFSSNQKLGVQWLRCLHAPQGCRTCSTRIGWFLVDRERASCRMEQVSACSSEADVWYHHTWFCDVVTLLIRPQVNAAAPASTERDSSSAAPSSRRRSRSRDRDYDRHDRRSHRSRSRSPRPSDRDRRRSRSRSYERTHRSSHNHSRSPRRRSRSPSRSRDVQVQGSLGEDISDAFIRTVASQVKGNDDSYAQTLMEYEKNNPRYSFFQDRVCSSPSA
jgi:hypothetical protein